MSALLPEKREVWVGGEEPEEEGSGVCFSLACDVRGGSMDGFKDGGVVADVA